MIENSSSHCWFGALMMAHVKYLFDMRHIFQHWKWFSSLSGQWRGQMLVSWVEVTILRLMLPGISSAICRPRFLSCSFWGSVVSFTDPDNTTWPMNWSFTALLFHTWKQIRTCLKQSCRSATVMCYRMAAEYLWGFDRLWHDVSWGRNHVLCSQLQPITSCRYICWLLVIYMWAFLVHEKNSF